MFANILRLGIINYCIQKRLSLLVLVPLRVRDNYVHKFRWTTYKFALSASTNFYCGQSTASLLKLSSTKMAPTTRQSTRNQRLKSSFVNIKTTREFIFKIRDENRKFEKACEQMVILNGLMKDISVRIERAMKADNNIHHYTLSQKSHIVEGIKYMFYLYAKKKVEEIDDLETEFYNTTGIVWDDNLLETSDTGNTI